MQEQRYKVSCNDFHKLIQEMKRVIFENINTDICVVNMDKVYTMHIEKYYMRIQSNLMISIHLHQITNNEVEMDIVSGGGKHGCFDWGTEISAQNYLYDLFTSEFASFNWTIEAIHKAL